MPITTYEDKTRAVLKIQEGVIGIAHIVSYPMPEVL